MKVIYILSTGHSGSTVLGSLLGNCPGAVHVGEFTNFMKVYSGQLERCSCGELPADCEFWAPVTIEFCTFLEREGLSLDGYDQLKRKVERGILKDKVKKTDLELYKRMTFRFFEIISKISECKVIIDSSKSPTRALALSRTFGSDFAIVYLQRKLFDVSKSFRRKRGKLPVTPFAKQILKEHFKFEYVRWTAGSRSCRFKFHELFDQEKVNRLLRKLGLPCAINLEEEFSNDHVIAGNRMRYNRVFHIKKPKVNNHNDFNAIERIVLGTTEKIRKISF